MANGADKIVTSLLVYILYSILARAQASTCPSIHVTCPCGQDGSTVLVPISRCMDGYVQRCKPCKRLRRSKICRIFKNCGKCETNPYNYGKCSTCNDGRFGKFCEKECQCLNGGVCHGHNNRRCLCTNGFTGKLCKSPIVVDCGSPVPPIYGDVLADNTTVNSIARYSCPKRFLLIGHQNRTCLTNGQWSGKTPTCEYSCNVPQTTAHSIVKVDTVSVLVTDYVSSVELIRTARFHCEDGYKLIGRNVLTCLPDGTWDSLPPKCVLTCLSPEPIINGYILNMDSIASTGDVVKYKCHANYHIEGHADITCFNGTWNLPKPKCVIDIQCPVLKIDDGHVEYSSRDRIAGSEAYIRCFDGYRLGPGARSNICKEDGRWRDEEVECIEVEEELECKEPEIPDNGWIDGNDDGDDDGRKMIRSQVSYGCEVGWYLKGIKDNYCEDGRWKHETPKCVQVVTCPVFKSIIGCKVCFGRDCSSQGVSKVNCYVPTSDVHLPEDVVPVGTVIEFSYDRTYYTLHGSKRRTCQPNGFWTGKQPVCKAKCGIQSNLRRQPKIRMGLPASKGQWPWQVGIMWREGATRAFAVMCGGTLISEEWVITAAHCVTKDKNDIRVMLGHIDHNRRFSNVLFIVVNNNFDEVTLDSDVALIKLLTPVTLTSTIRPVCLTNTSSEEDSDIDNNNTGFVDPVEPISNLTGTRGVVIGWETNENDEFTKTINTINITILDQNLCKQFYQDQNINITDNMLCAGGPNQEDACKGDSGGPLLVQDNDNRWRIVGIVSFGSNCSIETKQRFGVYTRIERFISWIKQDL